MYPCIESCKRAFGWTEAARAWEGGGEFAGFCAGRRANDGFGAQPGKRVTGRRRGPAGQFSIDNDRYEPVSRLENFRWNPLSEFCPSHREKLTGRAENRRAQAIDVVQSPSTEIVGNGGHVRKAFEPQESCPSKPRYSILKFRNISRLRATPES